MLHCVSPVPAPSVQRPPPSPSLPPALSLGFLTPTPLHSFSHGPGWKGAPSPPGKAGGGRACGRGPWVTCCVCGHRCDHRGVSVCVCVCVCVCATAVICLPRLHPVGAQPSFLFHSGLASRCPQGPQEWPRGHPPCGVSCTWWLVWGEACLSTESPRASQETDGSPPTPLGPVDTPTGRVQGSTWASGRPLLTRALSPQLPGAWLDVGETGGPGRRGGEAW